MRETCFDDPHAPGEHPATQLCGDFLADCARRRKLGSVLDAGTGDGVLALMAAGLGAEEVLAVDRDPDQAALAEARAARAGLSGVEVRAMPVERVRGSFEVVVANLWTNDLLGAADALAALTAPGGDLFCAGMRLWQVHEVRRALEARGLRTTGVQARAGWGALHLIRPGSSAAGDGGI
jgi:ribosomal protein L11 methyltransferase